MTERPINTMYILAYLQQRIETGLGTMLAMAGIIPQTDIERANNVGKSLIKEANEAERLFSTGEVNVK